MIIKVIKDKMFSFIENYNGAFFVGSLVTEKIIYINKKAEKLFGVNLENCDFAKILGISNEHIQFSLSATLENGRNSMLYNYPAFTANGEQIIVDIQLGYFDENNSEVFLELIPQNDTRMQMILHQINNSKRPEALLNIDKRLSIVHCNKAFHEVFDSNEELRHSHFQNDLVNGFLPELRQKLIDDILETLKKQSTFSTNIKVFSAIGEEKWYLFELEKRIVDSSGNDKVIAYMTDIEKQVELEEEVKTNIDFFKSVYNLIDGVWYTIDVKSKTLYHMLNDEGLFDKDNAEENKITDYINFLIDEDVVHPDDQDIYRKSAENVLKGINDECVVRFSFSNYNYKWYKVKGHHIYNDIGELVQIIGVLENVDQEQQLKEDYEYINQLFKAAQSLTDDIMYRIDVDTMILHYLIPEENLNDKMRTFGQKIPDYLNNLISYNIIHPDDHETYRQFTTENFKGNRRECIIRFSIFSDEYEWYSIKGYNIYDENGKISKIIGTLINIDEERKAKQDNSLLNQYLSIMQETTMDILYRVDVETMTLYHFSNIDNEIFSNKAINNYVQTFIEQKIIHPDDKDLYLKGLEEFNNTNETPEEPIRFSIYGGEYKWYKVTGKKIFDNKGKLIETFGALVNVDNEHKIQVENSQLNQYFSVFQDLTGNILYRVEMPSKTLHHSIPKAFGEKYGTVIDNHVEKFIKEQIIHPEDTEKYMKQLKEFVSEEGQQNKIPIRVAVYDNVYEWHTFVGKKILDNDNNIIEIVGAMINVDEKQKIKAQANTLNSYFKALQLVSGESFFIVDVKNKILTQTGKVAEELEIFEPIPNFPESIYADIHEDDLDNFIDYTHKSLGGTPSHMQMRVLMPNKEYQWYELYSQIVYNENGDILEVIGKMNNINNVKIMHEEFSMLYEYFDALQKLTDDKIFHIDIKNKVFRFTDSSNENHTISFKKDEFIEQMTRMKIILEKDNQVYKKYFDDMINGSKDNELKIQAYIGGKLEWYIVKTKLIKNKKNEPIEVFGKLENIQELIDLEQKANYDRLTSVLSRENFEEKIIEELSLREENVSDALIFIDIDDFKYINDNYGHKYGDFVLKAFAERVGNCIKKTDLMGRVGGDEFVVYLKNIGTSEKALERANTMLDRMKRPISNGKTTHSLGLSIGISITPNDGIDLATLYENADKAVYASKKRGKNTATLYSSDME